MQLVHWWALQYQPCENGPPNKLRRYSADWKALGSRAEFSMAAGVVCVWRSTKAKEQSGSAGLYRHNAIQVVLVSLCSCVPEAQRLR